MPFPKLSTINYQLSTKKGFTLIELLVAVTILAVITSIGSVAFNNAIDKGRDNRRKQDLATVKSALTLYYEANHNYPHDPIDTTRLAFASDEGDNWIPDLIPTYTKKLPKDPKVPSASWPPGCSDPNKQNVYCYLVLANYQNYTLWAQIENSNDPEIYNPFNSVCPTPPNPNFNYCLGPDF